MNDHDILKDEELDVDLDDIKKGKHISDEEPESLDELAEEEEEDEEPFDDVNPM